ncbi:MAG: hypothetical protein KJZ54_03405 [Phycisphaerales bacterium]|nr:hypothetical protein [Phycisphaerales bacterium]
MQPRAFHVGVRGERVAAARAPESRAWFLAGLIGSAIGVGAGGLTIVLAISAWYPASFTYTGGSSAFAELGYFACQVGWWLQWSLCFGWIVLRHRVARLGAWVRWLLAVLLTLGSWVGAGVIWEAGFWLW